MALYYKLCSLPKVMPNLFTFSMDIHFSTPVGLLTNMVYMTALFLFGFCGKRSQNVSFSYAPTILYDGRMVTVRQSPTSLTIIVISCLKT